MRIEKPGRYVSSLTRETLAVILAGAVWIARFYGGGALLVVGIAGASAYVVLRCRQFASDPWPGKAPLKPVIENYLPVFYGVFAIVQFLR